MQIGVWVHGLDPMGKGLAEELGLQSSGPAHTVGSPLGSLSLHSPKDWLPTHLSTLQDKLSLQAPGLGLGGESRALPVPFLPPPSTLSQSEGMTVGDRAGQQRLGMSSGVAV